MVGQDGLDQDQVARGLGHLLATGPHGADVQLRAAEGADARHRLRHRLLVGVVREAQVLAADQDVDRRAQHVDGHRGTLGVPPRTAPAPRAGPGRGVVDRRSPDRDVERVLLTGGVGRVGVRLEQRAGGRLVETGGGGDPGAPEPDGAVVLVGGAGVQQALGELLHGLDVVAGARLGGRRGHPQGAHRLLEDGLLGDRQLVEVTTPLTGGRREDVVDVGDVAADLRRDPGRAEGGGQQVGPHEGGRVAEVRDVVRGDPADVDPGRSHDPERPAGQRDRGGAGGGRTDPVRRVGHGGDQRRGHDASLPPGSRVGDRASLTAWPCGSDARLGLVLAQDALDDADQQHGGHEREDEAEEVHVADLAGADEARQQTADDGAEDAEHDGADDAEVLLARLDETRQRTDDQTHDQEVQNGHGVFLSLGVRHTRGGCVPTMSLEPHEPHQSHPPSPPPIVSPLAGSGPPRQDHGHGTRLAPRPPRPHPARDRLRRPRAGR
ncbi:hypothetical protein NOCARDAX2BIS_400150 [Nocardioides sp. AX2bis]|nr:hypothetical protein NOCARDAX2BIS_400150 [Nocardioides sp. AX2bis]